MARATERVLVVGPAWVGDMVMAQSLYKALKLDRAGIRIDVLAPDWSLPLLARMDEVDEAIRMPLGHGELGLLARRRIGLYLRERHYDRAIVLPRSAKAALVPYFAGAKVRTGYRGEMRYRLLNDIRPLDKERMPMVVQRYMALGQAPEVPVPPPNVPCPSLRVDEVNRALLLKRLELNTERPVVALAPGAEYGPAKQWPVESYGELARRLLADGFQVWQFGSDKDRAVAEAVDQAAGGATTNLCGRTRLEDAVDLLSLATVTVCNDSGLMHVAAAVNSPLVVLYGSSSPRYTPPLTRDRTIIHLDLPCSPCFERECKHGNYRCLRDISVDRVFAAVGERVSAAA